MKLYIFILLSAFSAHAISQNNLNDTLPPVSMQSGNLLTLDYYNLNDSYQNTRVKVKGEHQSIFTRRGAKFILPALFIAYGTAARFNQLPIREFDFDIEHEIKKLNPRNADNNKNLPIDNIFEALTPAAAYGLGMIPGIEARHNLRDRTLVMLTSFLVMEGFVYGLKSSVTVLRPRAYEGRHQWINDPQTTEEKDYFSKSFPSGHMAVAMTGAHLMYKEYKDVSPWIGVGGYLMATSTGVLRMWNDAHWFSDVMMSAGIGLLSVEIGYMLLPVWHKVFGIDDSGTPFVAMPQLTTQSLGVAMVYTF